MLRNFFNPTRQKVWPWLFVAVYCLVFSVWLLSADGIVDQSGSPIATDFITFYSAGVVARDGHPARIFDAVFLHQTEKRLAGRDVECFAWHYPPTFLLAVYPLSLLPYFAALGLWLVLTITPFLYMLLKIFPHPASAGIFLAFPGTFQNILHGQNGFLTASLLGGGLMLLESHTFSGGFLLGCLLYKPHLAILIVPALVAGRFWKALAGFAVSATMLIASSLVCWGIQPWQAFFNNISTAGKILETGAVPWFKMPTPFAASRLLGLSVGGAHLLQLTVSILALVFILVLWKSARPFSQRATGLIGAILLASPFGFDYDLVILAPAIALICSAQRLNRTSSSLFNWALVLWALPFLSPLLAKITGIVVAPFVIAAFCIRSDSLFAEPTPAEEGVRQ